jgi:hypothetical protein
VQNSIRKIEAGALLIIFVGTILGYLWWGRFQYRHGWLALLTYVIGLVTVLAGHYLLGDDRRNMGIRVDNLRSALPIFGWLTLGGLLLVVPSGLLWGNFVLGTWIGALTYLGWALIQQFLLQGFLRLRVFDLLDAPRSASSPLSTRQVLAAIIAAGIFGALHLPDLRLAAITFGAGSAWCLAFTRVPNLIASWLSHGILALLLVLFFQTSGQLDFRVGRTGYRYEGYGQGVQVAAGYRADGVPVVVTAPGPDHSTPSQIRVFSSEGRLLAEWEAFPEYDFSARIAVGDLGLGPGDELAVTPGPGPANLPMVRLYSLTGELLREYLIDELPKTYGASPSIGCGRLLVAEGPAPNASGQIISVGVDGSRQPMDGISPRPGWVNGVQAWPFPEDCGHRSILLAGHAVSVNSSDLLLQADGQGRRIETFPATYGLTLTHLRDRDQYLVAVAPGPLVGYPRWVRIFLPEWDWRMIHDFVVSNEQPTAGLNLAAVDVDGDGRDELVTGEGCAPGVPSIVRVVGLDQRIRAEWLAYP